jgi:hypothetical protein
LPPSLRALKLQSHNFSPFTVRSPPTYTDRSDS